MLFFSPVPGLKVSSAWTADGEESQGGKNRSEFLSDSNLETRISQVLISVSRSNANSYKHSCL